MVVITPLTLKSTKGMLEMQRLAPETKRLQQPYRNDRAKLNEEMMALYKEHKVNPMASCLPLLAQMPVFIIMFRVLHGLTYRPTAPATAPVARGVRRDRHAQPHARLPPPLHLARFEPVQVAERSDEMISFGLDLAKRPAEALAENFATGLIYVLLVALLGILYFVQQRMVAARAAVSPQMSPSQQKLMQYLPVAFAIFQVFFLLGLVIYYMAQAILRIGQQLYITAPVLRARRGARTSGPARQRAGPGTVEGRRRQWRWWWRRLLRPGPPRAGRPEERLPAPTKAEKAATAAAATAAAATVAASATSSKRTTQPKNRPTPSGKGPAGRPTRAPTTDRPGGPRGSDKKRR